jgi:ribosomal protein S11
MFEKERKRMWNGKQREVPLREVEREREGRSRKNQKRRRRRRKRKGRREDRGKSTRLERWFRVKSEARNTRVVVTWNNAAKRRRASKKARAKARGGDLGEGEKLELPRAIGKKKKKLRKARHERRVKKKEWKRREKKEEERAQRKERQVELTGENVKSYRKSRKEEKGGRRGKKGGKKRRRRVLGNTRKRNSVSMSAGMGGYKSVRQRGTDYAARKVLWRAIKKVKKRMGRGKSLPRVHVRREGSGKGSQSVKKTRRRWGVRSISDRTREAHNGCKGKKQRRR